jgi:NADH-quinone oxidoreductase subunit M
MILALPWIPLAAALILLFIPKQSEALLKRLTLLACWVCFLITMKYFLSFTAQGLNSGEFQHVYRFTWLPALGIQYVVGLDGINMTFCLLHALVSLAGAYMAVAQKERLKEYLFFYLILTGAIYGVFTVLDIFFMYLFYELTLIPLYPMIGIWGSKNKEYGAMKLTIFITAGAVLSLFGILLLYRETGYQTFDFITLFQQIQARPLSQSFQSFLAPLLLIGFGVIASLWPLHSWSPIGYAAAPTSVSMLHAGVLKKMGPYLILRLAVGLVPAGVLAWSNHLAFLAGVGIVYAGYAAIKQKDLKFMVGFSSVSHMGYVLLGIAAMTNTSLSGAVLLIFSHGVMAAATFALIGYIYEQTHMRGIEDYGGLGKIAPFWSICFIMASMASLGLPGFANFASELLVFIGSWQKYPVIVAFAIFGILITALYLLRAVQKVCYGPANPRWAQLKDPAGFSERFPFILLLGALMIFGFWPQGLLQIIRPAVGAMIP